MTPKLTPELTAALLASGNLPMQVIDPTTNQIYWVVDQQTHLQAMEALRQREDEASIQQGIDDLEAGRYSPADEAFVRVDAKLKAKLGR